MGKLFLGSILIWFTMVMSSCSIEKSAIFESDNNGIQQKIILIHQNDHVKKQTNITSISTNLISDQLNIDYITYEEWPIIQEFVEKKYQQYHDFAGVTCQIEYTNEAIITTVVIDYQKAKLTELATIDELAGDQADDPQSYVSFQFSYNLLLDQGLQHTNKKTPYSFIMN